MKINLQENFPIGAQPRLIYETIKADSVNDDNKQIRQSPHRRIHLKPMTKTSGIGIYASRPTGEVKLF